VEELWVVEEEGEGVETQNIRIWLCGCLSGLNLEVVRMLGTAVFLHKPTALEFKRHFPSVLMDEGI
jgi:hypothetical protein